MPVDIQLVQVLPRYEEHQRAAGEYEAEYANPYDHVEGPRDVVEQEHLDGVRGCRDERDRDDVKQLRRTQKRTSEVVNLIQWPSPKALSASILKFNTVYAYGDLFCSHFVYF